jgi:hypothetical protein
MECLSPQLVSVEMIPAAILLSVTAYQLQLVLYTFLKSL